MATSPNPDLQMPVIEGRATLKGEFDLRSTVHVEAWLATFEGPLEVDLGGVTFFDSSALRALLAAHRRNPRLLIVNPSDRVMHVLEITGTGDVLLHGKK